MALQVWLPFNRTYKNYGLDKDIKISSRNSSYVYLENDETAPIGDKSLEAHSTGYGITLNSSLGADILSDATEYSVSTFAYFNDTSKDDILICGPGAITCGICNNGIYLRTDANTGTTAKVITFPEKTANTWTHYAFTFKNGKIKAYVNGMYYTQATKGTKMIGGITTGHVAGHATGYTFDGKISDFRIYDNALTEEDVKRIYQQKLFELVPYSGAKDVLFDRSGFMLMPLVNNGAEFNANYLYFDGTNDQLRPKVTNSSFNISGGTLSIWFAPTEKPNKNRLIYTDVNSHMAIGFSSTGNALVVRCGTSNGNINALSTTGISWGSLNNVIVTYNDTMPQICLINGIIPSVYSSTSTGFTETAGKGLTIGGRQYNTTSRFDGKIYKVAVYKKQFTQDEAVELYNSERGSFTGA